MRLGIISDIHSNIDAQNVVLDEFEKEKVDKIICCGDSIGIGPFSNEVVTKLISLGDKLIAVRGNHENYLLKGFPKVLHNDKRAMRKDEKANHNWNHGKLDDNSKAFLQTLKEEKIIEVEDIKIYISHYGMDEDGTYKYMIKIPNEKECEELFGNIDADVYLFGHTHERDVIHANGKWYINPGACGCPKRTSHAFAGILNVEGKNVDYKQLEIEYDKSRTVNKIREEDAPMGELMIQIFF